MRLWSIDPSYLDRKALGAVWREALLAQKVLRGESAGYQNHTQLKRFRDCGEDALSAIAEYLKWIYLESQQRNYDFNSNLIDPRPALLRLIPVTAGQLNYEYDLLWNKVAARDQEWLQRMEVLRLDEVVQHPLFAVIEDNWDIEDWEKRKDIQTRFQYTGLHTFSAIVE